MKFAAIVYSNSRSIDVVQGFYNNINSLKLISHKYVIAVFFLEESFLREIYSIQKFTNICSNSHKISIIVRSFHESSNQSLANFYSTFGHFSQAERIEVNFFFFSSG